MSENKPPPPDTPTNGVAPERQNSDTVSDQRISDNPTSGPQNSFNAPVGALGNQGFIGNVAGTVQGPQIYFQENTIGQREIPVTGLHTIAPRIESWIERSQPQNQLLQAINDRLPLIEILGAGGFGKSWLAARIHQQAQPQFQHALWVNFPRQKVPTFNLFARWVLQEIWRVLDERRPDEELSQELVSRLIQQGRTLLVLDQLETLHDAPDRDRFSQFLTHWQEQGRNSTLLLTARQSLLPDDSNPQRSPHLNRLNRLHLTGFSPVEGTTFLQQHHQIPPNDDSRRLVELAVGHPLLLNLAATWLKQARKPTIDDTALAFFQQLFQYDLSNPEAQVGEIFNELFKALPAPLQTLLLGVSVYRDPFDLDAAQAMLPQATEADLQHLSQQAFLLEQSDRWSLHPLIQPLVQQTLQERDQTTTAHEHAIAYFQAHLKSSIATITDAAEYLEIFHHRCELQQYNLADQIMRRCVDSLTRLGHYRQLVPAYERLTRSWQAQAPADATAQRNLGWVWTKLGNLYNTLEQFHSAIAAHQQAQQGFAQLEDNQGKAACLNNLGNSYTGLGEYERAIDLHQQALAIDRELGNRLDEASCLGSLGNAHSSLGKYEQAIDLYQQALAIDRELGARHEEAGSLVNLGIAYKGLEQYEQAIDFYQQGLKIAQAIRSRHWQANALFNLALTLARYNLRRFEALDVFKQARVLFAAMGLDRQVEECDQYIHHFSGIIATEDIQRAPAIGAPPVADPRWEKSMPVSAPSRSAPSRSAPSRSSGQITAGVPRWLRLLAWGGGGLALAWVVHLLLNSL